MKSGRGNLYTFGCSMTSYNWPTWADILGKEYDYFENWAKPGAGNNFIFNSIIECLTKKNFGQYDTIIIMWSGITRIDYYQMNEWSHYHSVFDKKLPISCPNGAEIISYALFAAIDKILSLSKINYSMYSFLDYDSDSKAGALYANTLKKISIVDFPIVSKEVSLTAQHKFKDLYERHAGVDWPKLSEIFSYNKTSFNESINREVQDFLQLINNNKHLYFTSIVQDKHPTPMEHLTALKFITHLDIQESTVEWVKNIDQKIADKLPYFFDKFTPERL